MALSPELDRLVNNPSLLNALFLPLFGFISCLDPSNPCPCSRSCFHQCPWKNSAVPAATVLSGWKASSSRMCSRNFHKVLVLQGKEEFGLAGRSVFQQDVLSSLLDLQS